VDYVDHLELSQRVLAHSQSYYLPKDVIGRQTALACAAGSLCNPRDLVWALDHVYEFHFEKTIVLRRPLWVYLTSALSVACAIAAVVVRLA
jgi:hypothetical protein